MKLRFPNPKQYREENNIILPVGYLNEVKDYITVIGILGFGLGFIAGLSL